MNSPGKVGKSLQPTPTKGIVPQRRITMFQKKTNIIGSKKKESSFTSLYDELDENEIARLTIDPEYRKIK